jgi:hypothetical protein
MLIPPQREQSRQWQTATAAGSPTAVTFTAPQ